MDSNHIGYYAVMLFDLIDGTDFFGPFDSEQEAQKFIDKYDKNAYYKHFVKRIIKLDYPNE